MEFSSNSLRYTEASSETSDITSIHKNKWTEAWTTGTYNDVPSLDNKVDIFKHEVERKQSGWSNWKKKMTAVKYYFS